MENTTKILTLDGYNCKYVERAFVNSPSYDKISGMVSDISENHYTWEGETKYMLELTVSGIDGLLYILRGNKYSKVMYDYLNRLAGIDDLMQVVTFMPCRVKTDGYNEIRGEIRYGENGKLADYKYPDMAVSRPTEGKLRKLIGDVKTKITKLMHKITDEGGG